jgi:hypothetical protein
MKTTCISLTLFILTGPVPALAEPANKHATLDVVQHTYPDAFDWMESLPDPAYNEQPRYIKLIQAIEEYPQIKTIKANLTIQEPVKQTAYKYKRL